MYLWITPRCRGQLPEDSRAAYRHFAQLPPVDHYVEKQGRSTGMYHVATRHGTEAVFIKRYLRLPWWLRRLAPLARFPGPLEKERLEQAARLGIRVPEVIAAGADPHHPCGSFLAIKALDGYLPLHEFLPRHCPPEGDRRQRQLKHRIIDRLADCARLLHGEQLYHRDLYLCHFFLRLTEEEPDGFDLAMIDFLRLKHSWRKRWQVKDLAQLWFSAKLPCVTRTDGLRFMRRYLGVTRFDAPTKSWLRRIVRKADSYQKHNRKAALLAPHFLRPAAAPTNARRAD